MTASSPKRFSILHPSTFSTGDELAFAHALRIALKLKGKLSLLRMRTNDDVLLHTDAIRRAREFLMRWKMLANVKQFMELDKSSNARFGILEFLEDDTPDLVVLANHEHQGFRRWFDVTTEQSVLRRARASSLFLRGNQGGFVDLETGDIRLKNILVPVDGSIACSTAFGLIDALTISLSLTAQIHVMHAGACAPPLNCKDGRFFDLPVIVRDGPVVESILTVAQALKADLIAMPTGGRHGLLGALRGSTSARILDDGHFPLLSVPTG